MTPARPQKTTGGAYGMALLGFLLGIFGLHRIYLRQYGYGIALSAVAIAGLLLMVAQYVAIMSDMLAGLTAAATAGGDANFADIPDVSNLKALVDSPPPQMRLGMALFGVGLAWFVVDLFFVPWAVRKHNAGA
jgi:TM2 domain-containing membrane protein YozV